MIEIAKIIDDRSLTEPNSEWFDVIGSLGISRIDHLFNRLDGAYPHWWRNNFPDDGAVQNWRESWVESFDENGITPESVRLGLAACKANSDKPPSLSEFMKFCKGGILTKLDPEKAYHEAYAGLQQRLRGEVGTWSHPAIFWASSKLSFDIRHQTYQSLKSRWEHALNAELAIGAWSDVPKPEDAEPALQIAYNREEKTAAAQQMRNLIERSGAVKKPDDNVNYREWAMKIRDDWQRKGKKYPWISYKMADEVLNFLPKRES